MSRTASRMEDDLTSVLQSVKWTSVIDSLTPTSTFTLDPFQPVFKDLFLEAGYTTFTDVLRKAVYNIMHDKYIDIDVPSAFDKLKIKLEIDKIFMHDITAKYENSVISFDTTIIATDSPKTYIKECKLECPKCNYGFSVTCDNNRKIPMEVCANPSCRDAKLIPDQDTLITEYIQTVFLQEPLEEAKKNSPVMFIGKIKGDNVGTAFVGQRKRITGLFKTVFDPKNIQIRLR